MRQAIGATLLLALFTACAVRMGGHKPEPYSVVAVHARDGEAAQDVAAQITAQGGQIAFVTADRDTAWFGEIATQTGLELSGPGRTGRNGLAFYTNLKILGDTSIVLLIPSGGRVHMHDALFEISEDRNIDLMFIDVDGVEDLRDATRTLLSYIATDVGNNIPLIIGVAAPSTQVDDSVALLIRAAFSNARDCAADAGGEAWAGDVAGLHLLFGPPARMQCENARAVLEEGSISARLIAR